jgi:hypothetical protein
VNTLSWLIYASDVIPNLGGVFIAFAIGSAIFCAILFIFGSTTRDSSQYSRAPKESQQDTWDRGKKSQITAFKLLAIPVICILIAVVIPSKNTFLMIAASEVGETVVKTDEAKAILKDLQDVIQTNLQALKPKAKTTP